jgi:hypothetical protein
VVAASRTDVAQISFECASFVFDDQKHVKITIGMQTIKGVNPS